VSVRRSVVAEVDGRQSDPEKRVSALRAKSRGGTMCGDGDLACGNLGVAKVTHAEPWVKGRRGPGRSGNHHVTASGFGNDSHMRVSDPHPMEGTLG